MRFPLRFCAITLASAFLGCGAASISHGNTGNGPGGGTGNGTGGS